jgi:hypothetical protein
MRARGFMAIVLTVAVAAVSAAAPPAAAAPREPTCVGPAAPGGGMDSACRIAAERPNRVWTDGAPTLRRGASADLGVARPRAVNDGLASMERGAVTAFPSGGTRRTLAGGGISGTDGRPLGVDDAGPLARVGGGDDGDMAEIAEWRGSATATGCG